MMRKVLSSIIAMLLLSAVAFAQNTETRKPGSFDEIRVAQAITVYLKSGAEEEVKVVAKGIDVEDVLTDVSGGRLKIHLAKGNHKNTDVDVYVTYKSLEGITASSASSVFSEGVIKGEELTVSVSSAADVEIEVDVEELDVNVSSSGDLEVAGKARKLDVSASSAGGVDAYDLDASVAYVRASSAGGVKVSVRDEINAEASSGGSIKYKGDPGKSQTDSSSGGSVRKSN
ncbi:DUF2807 domain-containing protein [Fulvivirga sp. RKSG066]|uniref:head GIN domain-containing protein n=1 Tax=Fulvivirga aurantia TaxID=2529383 RepID=UPI0012BCB4BA|nr:head GIN domain-containing protein [Fulvivirga aurantia]MTI20077.1 DUF2807 domain-containing protein [Fulvivirga aurantia]